MKRGYVYYARLDKRRPALVISPDYRNVGASDVLIVPCSTILSDAPTHIRLRRGEGGVTATSILKCEQITTIHKDDVDPAPLGTALSGARLREVERAILRAIGVPVPI
jgi:mRNA-degrading endonuclease toxin of MazEF toxin-antitoxin module